MTTTWVKTKAGYTAALGGNNVVIQVPDGPTDGGALAVGDLLVVHVSNAGSAQTWTGPASWGGQAWTEAIDSQSSAVYWLYIANSTILAGSTGTVTCTKAGNTSQCGGSCTRYTGVHPSAQIDVVSVSNHQVTAALANAVTPTYGNDYIAHLFFSNTSTGNGLSAPVSGPAGTVKHSASPGSGVWIGVGEATGFPPGVSTGIWTYVEGIAGAVWDSATVAIRNPPLDIGLNLLTSSATFYAPAVSTGQQVGLNLLTSAKSFFSPAVTQTAAQVGVGLLTAGATFYAPKVSTRLQKWRTTDLKDLYGNTGDAKTIVCVGDSITELFYAGTGAHLVNGWIPRLAEKIVQNSGSPNHAALYMPASTGPSSAVAGYVYPEGSDPWTRNGGQSPGSSTHGHGLGRRAAQFLASATATITAPSWATHATAGFATNGAGAHTARVYSNAVQVGTVTIANGDTDEHPVEVVLQGASLDFQLKCQSGLGLLYAEGAVFDDRHAGDARLRVLEAGHGGITAVTYAGATSPYYWAQSLAYYDPTLVVILLGVNDAQAAESKATFKAALEDCIDLIDGACAGNSNGVPDLLLVAYPYCDATTAGGTFYSTGTWASYVDAMQEVVDALPFERAALLDLQADGWFPAQSGPSAYTTDGVHPASPVGSEAIAAALQNEIDPQEGVYLSFLAAPATFHSPTVTTGPVAVAMSVLTAAATFYSPAVGTGSVQVSPGLLTSSATFYVPAVTTGSVTVSLGLLTSAATFHQPAVGTGQAAVSLSTLTAAATFFGPAVVSGSVSVSVGLLTASSTFYAPSVAAGSVAVALGMLTAPGTFHAPAVATGSVSVTLGQLLAPAAFYEPTLTVGAVEVGTGLLSAGATFFSPSTSVSAIPVTLALLAAPATFYGPTVLALVAPIRSARTSSRRPGAVVSASEPDPYTSSRRPLAVTSSREAGS